jgi:uncharacterized damage-inducible protein DinB
VNRDELLRHPLAFAAPGDVLDGLSAEGAARNIAELPHSIVEILAHMVFWQDWFLARCSGVATPLAAHAAEGWPAAGAADWAPLRERFLAGLDRAMALPEEGRVEPPIEFPPMAEYTITEALTHLAQHNAHHLGQIVTLRQALGVWPPPSGGFTW